MPIPKDPIMLLSFVNMKLRDEFSNLDDLCQSLSLDKIKLEEILKGIDYIYDRDSNQFV